MLIKLISNTLKPISLFFKKYSFPVSNQVTTYKSLKYALSGSTTVLAAHTLYESYINRALIDKEGSDAHALLSVDRERKQKVVASVYKTMGVNLSPHQVHISYDEKLKEPSFYHNLFSNDVFVRLPMEMKFSFITAETELVASAAKQAAHDKEQHLLYETTVRASGAAGAIYTMTKYAGFYPRVLIPISYILMLVYLHRQLDYRSDREAVKYFPDYASSMIEIMRKSQENPSQLTRYHQYRSDNILQSRSEFNQEYNKTSGQVLRWMSLHRRLFDQVQPMEKYKHPLTRALKDEGLHLNRKQADAIIHFSQSARIYIPENIELILKEFFEANKKQSTPLGTLYHTLSFSDFIERLITKTFKTIYLDGRVVRGRMDNEDRLAKALPDYPKQKIECNLELLTKIGGELDALEVFFDYLTLEEIGIKSLLIEQAISLPIGDGRRDTEYLATSKSDIDFKLPIIESMSAAVKRPVVVASVSGIEARNGKTAHPDLFMIFAPKSPNKSWDDRAQSLRQSPYYLIANKIYGDKLAIDQHSHSLSDDKDFVLFGDGIFHEEWYVCTSAYKNRMKVLYSTLLKAADQQMEAYNLGHSYNLKGLGLGFFGFSAAIPILERLSKEALCETLAEIELKHIQQINLINWPSQVENTDLNLPLHKQLSLRQINMIRSVKIYEGIAETFSSLDEAGDIGGTHACADAASQFGNEVHIGMPPSSSDEAATYYSILDPTLLIPEENPNLTLRLLN